MSEQTEYGSPEHKAALYLERKKDVARVARHVLPYLLAEADKADEQDLEEVTVSVSSVYSACNVMSFIDNLEMYERELREEKEQLQAKLQCAQIHLEAMKLVLAPLSVKAGLPEGKLTELLAETIKAVKEAVRPEEVCDGCGGPLGDDAPHYEDADICLPCHKEIQAAEAVQG